MGQTSNRRRGLAPAGVVLTLLLLTPRLGPRAGGGSSATDAPQQKQEQPPLPSSLVEHVEVRFVTLDLVVEERAKGGWRRATDLRKEDVAVHVGGEPVELELFENWCRPEGTLTVAAGEEASAGSAAGGPVAARTAAAAGAAPPIYFILYFDLTHLTNEGANLAYKAALAWAEGGARPDDPVMIVTGGDGLRVVRPFVPASQHLREDLLAAREDSRRVERWAEFEESRIRELIDLASVGADPRGLASAYASVDFHRVRTMLRNLQSLMTIFESIEGPKNLLIFENTVRSIPGKQYPFTKERELTDAYSFLHRLAQAANEREVRIYPVHAGGVEQRADDAMTLLASETGGRVMERTNLLDPAFARVEEDASCFYRVGFHSARRHSGEDERIAVLIRGGTRGFRVRHRRTLDDPTRKQQEVDRVTAAFLLPDAAAAFPVTVSAVPLFAHRGGGRTRVQVRVAVRDLIALPSTGAEVGATVARAQVGLTVIPLRALDPGETSRRGGAWSDAAPGKRAWSVARQSALTLPAGWSGERGPRDLVLVQEVQAPPGAYRVVAVVEDRLANAVAAATAEFEVAAAPPVLGPIHLLEEDARAIRVDQPSGEDDETDKRKDDELGSAVPALPSSMLIREAAIVEEGGRATVAYGLCDPARSHRTSAARTQAEAGPFAGWRLERALTCGEGAPPIPLSAAPLPPPGDPDGCALLTEPLPPAALRPGPCRFQVTLERPGTDPEMRWLDFEVVATE